MSLAGRQGGRTGGSSCPMSRRRESWVGSKVPYVEGGGWVGLFTEVQCIMGNGHMGHHLWTDRHA